MKGSGSMPNSELLVKVDADIKGIQNKFKQIRDKTKNLEDGLKSIAKNQHLFLLVCQRL